ncbi:MAG: type II secretion system F family protein [Planctomycetota bacterium]|nr:type II secretion system F family protein [Planctomycetota bacterium]
MAVFVYRGSNPDERNVKGTILADSPRHARDQLRERGIVVHAIDEQQRGDVSILQSLGQFGYRKARAQWGLVAHEMSMLLSAGIPLLEALDDLASQHRGAIRTGILKLRDKVESGASLAAAMEEQPMIFDPASVRLVEVGENAGKLEVVLAEVAEFKLQLSEFKDRVTTALLYPIFLACFTLAAMLFLMTWVMPPLLESLEESLTELPLPTQIAKSISDLFVGYGWWILAGMIMMIAAIAVWLRSPFGRRLVDRLVLRIPILGPILIKQSVARIATIVGLLSRGGVMLTTAVQLAAKSTRNTVLQEALFDAERAMVAGGDIADSLRASGCFPSLAIRFFAVGQESGKLDEMLQKLASDYNKQVATASARITAFVEPVMILILSVAVGFLLLATILPILEAGNVS